MKNIALFLEKNPSNDQLIQLLQQNPDYRIVQLNEIQNEKVTVIVNGPLTSLSKALLNNWKLKDIIDAVLLVGGSDAYGDVTPCAEKNIYADPEAAQAVFMSGVHIIMFGLNITRSLTNRALVPYAYLLNKDIFKCEECGIYVETKGHITRGKTVTDIYSDKQFENHNCEIVLGIDLDTYHQVI